MAADRKEVSETAHFTCIWKLENIGITFDLYSPTLTAQAIEMTRWNLRLYCGIAGPIILLISRKSKDSGPERIKIKFELSFLGIDGFPLKKEVGEKQFLTGDSFVYPKFADEYQVLVLRRAEFLPKGVLTIRWRMWRTGTDISKSDLYLIRTSFEADRCFHDLIIEKFTTLQPGQIKKFLLKPPSTKNYKLTFQLYIVEVNSEECLCLDIKYNGIAWHNIKICLLDFEKKVVHSDEKSGTFCCSFFNFIKRNELVDDEASLLPNDVLTLRCEIEGKPKIVWNGIENCSFLKLPTQKGSLHLDEQYEASNCPCSSMDAIKRLCRQWTLTDADAKAVLKSFPAAKRILSASYPEALSNTDLKERASEYIEISDVNEDISREPLYHKYLDTARESKRLSYSRGTDKHELLELTRIFKSNFDLGSVCNGLRTERNSIRFRFATKRGSLSIRFTPKSQRPKLQAGCLNNVANSSQQLNKKH